ncbi:hypothetical protein LJR168_001727 [Pseudoxanthomonas sp. LjRoot168]|uniref:hypothetical protein n=1 Tax=unclassified Pseudoxanthomonas TaxID=2645906 RepID=UPI003ECC8376
MRRMAAWALLAWALTADATEPRRQIGQVDGQPVYADQIVGEGRARADSAREVFMVPVLSQWMRRHADAARPTAAEKQRAEAAITAYAACSNNGYALPEEPAQKEAVLTMLIGNVKLQKRLHDTYGGGRLLFQQAGVEAFDATRRMLESREAAGGFAITDPDVRALAYDYWTRDHGAFIISDPGKIAEALDVTSLIARCPD